MNRKLGGKHMKKTIAIMVMAFMAFMVFSLIACSKDVIETPSDNQENNEEINMEEELKEGEVEENRYGEFKGFISEKSIEIIIDEAVPVEFEYMEELSDSIKELKDGDRVLISYIKKVEGEGKWFGHMLTDIEKLAEETKLPEKKMLKMTLEGMEEEREAILEESKYGYYIYMLNGFSFSETDTAKSLITMDYDKDFNVNIAILPNDINHDEWKEAITNELKKFGKVHQIDPKEHFDPYFHDADYYYLASDANRGDVIYMMKEIDGTVFQFRVNMPLKEAMEGATPAFWTMLKTITLK